MGSVQAQCHFWRFLTKTAELCCTMAIYTFNVVGKVMCHTLGSTCIVFRLHIQSKETWSVSGQAASRASELLLKVIPTFRSQSSRVSDVNNH